MENQYSKEYRIYMEYALQKFLMETYDMSEQSAKLKVAQDYDDVMKDAKEKRYL